MSNGNITNNYYDRLIQMISEDTEAVHILWNCTNGKVIPLGKQIIPENVTDPLDYLRESDMVEQTSLPAFEVYCSQIEEGIISGTNENSLGIDVQMRLEKSGPYELYHVYALFLRDEKKRITDMLINIRLYTSPETFNRQILTAFSSDKCPQLFTQRIAEMMRQYEDKQIAFIQFDIEHFNLLNDIHGSDVGDELLQFINDSLGVLCSAEQPFCRLSADIFMIVTVFETKDELLGFVRMLESRLEGYKGLEYRLTFGIAIAEDKSLSARNMGDHAAFARKTIKGNALKNVAFYDGSMKKELHKKQSIEDDMYRALLNNEFVMFLQPKHCISTGRIIGAEALARWVHPEKGMISPAEFIPVFEENGFILKLDQIIWESACRKIREWIDRGIEPVPISVNVSREYLNSFDVIDKIVSLVKKYNIPAKLLELEITESVDAEGTDNVVKKMKEAGFTMLMDDFGSGYSSLNMLKTTQFDVLKIDRNFLSEFMESSRGRKIISHTISMSRDIGLDIIAEGVETLEQAKFLNECGCDAAQGFYYSKPVPTDTFDKRLIEINT